MLSNLPPGVTDSMIPGNRPEDDLYDRAAESIDKNDMKELCQENCEFCGMAKWEMCDGCGGSGKDEEGDNDCLDCHGYGQVFIGCHKGIVDKYHEVNDESDWNSCEYWETLVEQKMEHLQSGPEWEPDYE